MPRPLAPQPPHFFGFWPKSAPDVMNHPKKGRAQVSYYIEYYIIV